MPIVVPSSLSVNRPIYVEQTHMNTHAKLACHRRHTCAHVSNGSMHTLCSSSITHVTTAPDLTNIGGRLDRMPMNTEVGCAHARVLACFHVWRAPVFLSMELVSSTTEHSSAIAWI